MTGSVFDPHLLGDVQRLAESRAARGPLPPRDELLLRLEREIARIRQGYNERLTYLSIAADCLLAVQRIDDERARIRPAPRASFVERTAPRD